LNGSISRKIRRSVYGAEYSPRKKEYGKFVGKTLHRLIWPEEKVALRQDGQMVLTGLRSKYKAVKKGYKAMKRRGMKNPLGFLLKNKGGS
jgi:hypothetical protein